MLSSVFDNSTISLFYAVVNKLLNFSTETLQNTHLRIRIKAWELFGLFILPPVISGRQDYSFFPVEIDEG